MIEAVVVTVTLLARDKLPLIFTTVGLGVGLGRPTRISMQVP